MSSRANGWIRMLLTLMSPRCNGQISMLSIVMSSCSNGQNYIVDAGARRGTIDFVFGTLYEPFCLQP